ncbi:FAD-dependent oxidoreductase [Sulfuritalea hydrogenivorans]|uniref:BzdV protein n=1 Tax=Sulfuritalea hydrogenivorans sk43H TaxID=1223802 RepID=W0SEH9_9PROT|nr:FAD-dependent oxidoreductase [Sulfuritalea hydrogenivorans]BAO29446.1 BzdV protein [Sulfuritalea hydrogenivorans sk43H]
MQAIQTSEIRWYKTRKAPSATDADAAACVGITIDGKVVQAPAGVSLLSAATAAGIYIPALCAHPDLPPACQRGGSDSGCNLCVVEIAGTTGMRTSCSVPVEAGMVVTTTSPAIDKLRKERIAKTLGTHPHVCLTCPQREGCSRTTCSFGNPVEQRCCSIFNSCELRKVSDYVGIPPTTPNYKHIQLPVIKDEPFYDRDYNLCIDCRRCLVACNEVRGVGCLEVKNTDGRTWVGTIAATLLESGCKFCSACVTVCPTGALMDRTLDVARKEETQVPCKATCPAGIDVPRYVQLVGLGMYGEAVAVVREKLPFPGILGRACFSPCESACRRKDLDDPLSIRSLKRIAADNDTGLWRKHSIQLPPSGKRAAVVGAGPGGLTAAYYLAKKGHSVTVFDALPAAGGMARYGIPSYRVPLAVIDQEVGEVEKLGVEFRFNTRIENVDDLKAQGFDAVFLGIGAQNGDPLGIPGDNLPNVVDSPTFLRAATMGKIGKVGADGTAISIGKRVAVIGGGNVATDNARSARRLGAEVVDMVYRRTQEEMPARDDEVQGCIEEQVNLRFLLAPKKIELNESGTSRLRITYVRMQLGEPDASGRRRPMEIAGSEFTEDVDLVIGAIGQRPEVITGYGVQLAKNNRVQVREDNMLTSRPGVYAGGDCVLGPSTLIESVAQGRKAAAAMDAFLGGDGNIEEKLLPDWDTDPYIGREEGFNTRKRLHPIFIDPAKRNNWDEVELGFDEATARAEALRCLKCNLAAKIEDMVLPPEAWLELTAENVAGVQTESGVYQLLDADKKVLVIRGVENLREGLEAMLDKADIAKYFVWEDAPFFSQRENQLVQAYMQQYGGMPPGVGADEMDDLF